MDKTSYNIMLIANFQIVRINQILYLQDRQHLMLLHKKYLSPINNENY